MSDSETIATSGKEKSFSLTIELPDYVVDQIDRRRSAGISREHMASLLVAAGLLAAGNPEIELFYRKV